jgi:hypothetical protein
MIDQTPLDITDGGLSPSEEDHSKRGILMLGLMQNRPLLISNLVDYVAT